MESDGSTRVRYTTLELDLQGHVIVGQRGIYIGGLKPRKWDNGRKGGSWWVTRLWH